MYMMLKRAKKTTKDQVEMYVKFLEMNPIVAMARSNPNNDEMISALWKDLTLRLNASDLGPHKSLQQWQETFANWRYQLTFKARKILEMQESGSDSNWELGQLEVRALKAMPGMQTSSEGTSFKDTKFGGEQPELLDSADQNERRPRRKFTKKRARSSTPNSDHRVLRSANITDHCSPSLKYDETSIFSIEDRNSNIDIHKTEPHSPENLHVGHGQKFQERVTLKRSAMEMKTEITSPTNEMEQLFEPDFVNSITSAHCGHLMARDNLDDSLQSQSNNEDCNETKDSPTFDSRTGQGEFYKRCTQTKDHLNKAACCNKDNEATKALRLREIRAMESLENAVTTLNETIKSLIDIQMQILSPVVKR